MNNYSIRVENERDYSTVESLVRESFWNVYRPGCTEHYVLHHLRNCPDFIPELAFVMEADGKIIGQNVFVKAQIIKDAGFTNEPEEIKNPKYLDAYFNTADGCSYIYDGENWTLLAGKKESPFIWKGELESSPLNPEKFWVYYNTKDSNTYIYDGTKWATLSKTEQSSPLPSSDSSGTYCNSGEHFFESLNVTDSTCIKNGIKISFCTKCNYYKMERLELLPHIWDSGIVTKQATCITDGVKLYTCQICSTTKNESIPAVHSWIFIDINQTTGEEVYQCTACNMILGDPFIYTIQFDNTDCEGYMEPITVAFYESTIDLPANSLTNNSLSFLGWATSKDNQLQKIISFNNSSKISNPRANLVLYPIWGNPGEVGYKQGCIYSSLGTNFIKPSGPWADTVMTGEAWDRCPSVESAVLNGVNGKYEFSITYSTGLTIYGLSNSRLNSHISLMDSSDFVIIENLPEKFFIDIYFEAPNSSSCDFTINDLDGEMLDVNYIAEGHTSYRQFFRNKNSIRIEKMPQSKTSLKIAQIYIRDGLDPANEDLFYGVEEFK